MSDTIIVPAVLRDLSERLHKAADKQAPVTISLLRDAAKAMDALAAMPNEVAELNLRISGMRDTIEEQRMSAERNQRLVGMVRDGFNLINGALAQIPAPVNIALSDDDPAHKIDHDFDEVDPIPVAE